MRNHIRRILCLLLVLLATLLLTACATTQSRYEKAQKLLANGEYAAAAEVFSELGSYEDATTLTMYSRACAAAEAGDYLTAITTLESMGDYKDCPLRVTYYTARAYEDKAGTDDWVLMLEAQEIYRTIPLFMDSQTRISALDGRVAAAKAAQYDAAVTAGESGRYSTAISAFRHLGSYQDSRTRITYYTIRQDADALAGSTDQDAIIATASRYADMGAYLDCPDRAAAMTAQADKVVADKYARVDALIAQGKYDEATALLNRFGVYGSSEIPAKFYAMGEHAQHACDWSAAADAYSHAGNHSDAPTRQTYFSIRADEDTLKGTTDQDVLISVAKRYTAMGAYLDCPDRAATLTARADEIVADKYAQMNSYIAEEQYDNAISLLNHFGIYGYDKNHLTYAVIRKEEAALVSSTDQDVIITLAQRYAKLGSHADCHDRAASLTARADQIVADKYAKVDAYIADGEYDKATSLLAGFGSYGSEEVPAKYYDLGEHATASGSYGSAMLAYRAADSYSDATTKTAALMSMISNRISAGRSHTVALRRDGSVVAVGDNSNSQLNVSGWKNIVAISASDTHTVGLCADGSVVAVGDNSNGQCDVCGWEDIVAISAGSIHTVGLRADGSVVAVGNNSYGQCDVSDWKNIIAISTGYGYTVGLRPDGTVVAIGQDKLGQCDVSGWENIVAISAGDFHTVGLRADGTVVAVGWIDSDRQRDISGWKNIIAISAGVNHTVGLRADGSVVATGYNGLGQCNVFGWKNIVAITAGGSHTIGLRTDGSVVAVGYSDDGQCDVSDWNLFD